MRSESYTPDPTGVPIFNSTGEVVARVLLDPEDAVWACQHRWGRDPNGYVRRRVYTGAYVRRHAGHEVLSRRIMGLQTGDPRRVDHINGDKLDNRRSNLRIATDAQNAPNQGSRGGSSRHRGVTWDRARGKWMAYGTLNGRRKALGRFDSEDRAAEVAAAWRAEHMPYSQEARTHEAPKEGPYAR
jgi:hypothetical protein